MTRTPRLSLITLLAAAALAACGGGGGGGGSTPTITVPTARAGAASSGADITVANFPSSSTQSVDALLATVGGGLALSQPLSAGRANAASVGRWAAARSAAGIATAARKQAQAVDSERFQCTNFTGTGGYIDVTINDADNNSLLTAGDSASFAFVDCIAEAGTPAIDGGFTLVFNALVLNSQQEPTAFDATLTMSALTVEGLASLNGSARLWVVPVAGGERSFVRYERMTSVTAGVTSVLDFDADETIVGSTASARIDGNLRLGSQTYAVAQLAAFDTSNGDPASGQLRITDAQGDRLLITARGTLVDRELFLAGNTSSTPDAAIIGTPWSAFKQ